MSYGAINVGAMSRKQLKLAERDGGSSRLQQIGINRQEDIFKKFPFQP